MSTVTPITGGLVLKNAQYAEETTYGVFPTNPAMKWIGYGFLNPQLSTGPLTLGHIGEETPRFFVSGPLAPLFIFTYSPTDSTFLKYAVNPAAGTGTLANSFSLLGSVKLGGSTGTETFRKIQGCRPSSLTLSGAYDQRISAVMTCMAKTFPLDTTTSPLGTGTAATDPALVPWDFYDGGAHPITLGSYTPDVKSIQLTFDRSLLPVHHIGESSLRLLRWGRRRITGRFSVPWQDTNQLNLLVNLTPFTLTWTLKTASLTMTVTRLNQLQDNSWGDPAKTIYESYGFQALGATLT